MVTRYKVRGRVSCRYTHRAFKALTLDGKVPVRDIDHILKRAGVIAARVCTGVAARGLSGSLAVFNGGLGTSFKDMAPWPDVTVGQDVVAASNGNGVALPASVDTATVDR